MRIIKVFADGCQCFGGYLKVVSLPKQVIMNPVVTPEIHEVMTAVHYRPAVSIIIPFEPKMCLTTELTYSLKTVADA